MEDKYLDSNNYLTADFTFVGEDFLWPKKLSKDNIFFTLSVKDFISMDPFLVGV